MIPDERHREGSVSTESREAAAFKYSVVIPVFNSEGIVGETVERTVGFFRKVGWQYEIILINDGSGDNSWDILAEKARGDRNIVAINLLKNYGQHTAVFCGLKHATGDFVITIDDDLQNPPEEIIRLVAKALEGYDVVFGRFRQKKHAYYRRLGSRLISSVNRRVFGKPKDLEVTNFRIMSREVVGRILTYRTSFPYINGLLLMFSSKRANVWVEHHPRKVGKSSYGWMQLFALVARILFNYSALLALCVGFWFLLKALLFGTSVAGWASIVVLLSFLGGVNIVIVSMVGEYLIRLVRQSSESNGYHITNILNSHE
jgi:polyisoprenyl-phosphate glycosyltransferase